MLSEAMAAEVGNSSPLCMPVVATAGIGKGKGTANTEIKKLAPKDKETKKLDSKRGNSSVWKKVGEKLQSDGAKAQDRISESQEDLVAMQSRSDYGNVNNFMFDFDELDKQHSAEEEVKAAQWKKFGEDSVATSCRWIELDEVAEQVAVEAEKKDEVAEQVAVEAEKKEAPLSRSELLAFYRTRAIQLNHKYKEQNPFSGRLTPKMWEDKLNHWWTKYATQLAEACDHHGFDHERMQAKLVEWWKVHSAMPLNV